MYPFGPLKKENGSLTKLNSEMVKIFFQVEFIFQPEVVNVAEVAHIAALACNLIWHKKSLSRYIKN